MVLNETLNLFFPQWQGANNPGLYEGAQALLTALSQRAIFTTVPVSRAYSLSRKNTILGHQQILRQLQQSAHIITTHNPIKIFTIGGDCGVELTPVSFLNQKHHGDLAVVWLDAHGDLNTPESSPNGHFHGMPLRSLLGEGDSDLIHQTFCHLKPEQIFLVGTRALDSPESVIIQQQNIAQFSTECINKSDYNSLISAIKDRGFSNIYIHLDLDVIDPSDFPHIACPTPNGIHLATLRDLLIELSQAFQVMGASVLECLPTRSTALSMQDAIAQLDNQCLSVLWPQQANFFNRADP